MSAAHPLRARLRPAVVLAALTLATTASAGCPTNQDDKASTATLPVKVDDVRYRVPLLPGDQALGADTPLVTIVVFTDYACPPCGRTWQVMDHLVEDYGDDLRVVFRSYTIPGFARAEQAAEAALTAGAQGKFWQMHRRLFEHAPNFDRPTLLAHAEALGLDVKRFTDELDTGAQAAPRVQHRRQAKQLGIVGLPAMFINGRFVSGFVEEKAWHALVDQEIAAAKEMLAQGTPRAELYDAFMQGAVTRRVGTPEAADELQEKLAQKQAEADPLRGKDLKSPKPDERYRIEAGDAPAIGPDDAQVQVVAFLDYACPYCRRAWDQELQMLIEQKKGEVKFAVRHFPLPIHPSAKGAAQAAMAAQAQGKFWEFQDKLLRHDGGFGRDLFLVWAKELDLDEQAFLAALDDPELASRIDEDQRLGYEVGVTGTPGFFVNGRYVRGFSPGALNGVIDEELEHAQELREQGVAADQVAQHIMSEAIAREDFPNR